MRIAHVNTERGWRGGEIQMRRLALGLAREGHRNLVVVRAGGLASEKFADDPVQLACLPLRSELDLPSAWKLGRLLRREAVEIVHAHTSHAATLCSLAARWAGGIPVVASRRLDSSLRRNPLGRWKYTWGISRVIAVADDVKRVLVEDGLDPDRVDVVRSACDLRLFEELPARADARSRLELAERIGLREDAPLLVTVAALAGHKDLPTLLRAVAILREDHPDLRAVIVGEGEERPVLTGLLRALGLEGTVMLAGHRDDVPVWLAAADVFVLTSLREGIGGALLEAQAARLPVVATRVSGLPEAVREGETASLVPPGDPAAVAAAVGELLGDADARARMGAAGRAFVESNFDVGRLVRETLASYEKALEARRRRA